MVQLSPEARAKGVITASAGNHAQGVALSAQKLGCQATIVMPETTPQIKIDAVAARGAAVVLAGDSYDGAYQHALLLAAKTGQTYVPPFDDEAVIAGQGTIGMEITRQLTGIDAVFISVGGGGLLAGVGAYIKTLYPQIKIIGVEPNDADAMTQSLRAGKRIRLEQVGIFADGVAVKEVGVENFRVCQACVDDMVLVNADAMCAAIKDVFEDTRSILEPAGALAIAGAKHYAALHGWQGKKIVAIASGANMNFDRLRHVAERAELGEAREVILAVTIPEEAGSFRRFCATLGARNITEFNYRYADDHAAHVFVGIATQTTGEAAGLIDLLKVHGFDAQNLTDNEMAKLHARHLVGGHLPKNHAHQPERLFRFEFPERPGALMRFLNALHMEWNISLFHYRNHGADYGRVLVGLQVSDADYASFQDFLAQMTDLGYPSVDENHNPAYHLFLS